MSASHGVSSVGKWVRINFHAFFWFCSDLHVPCKSSVQQGKKIHFHAFPFTCGTMLFFHTCFLHQILSILRMHMSGPLLSKNHGKAAREGGGGGLDPAAPLGILTTCFGCVIR